MLPTYLLIGSLKGQYYLPLPKSHFENCNKHVTAKILSKVIDIH